MARLGKEERIDQRASRLRLKPRHLPYWRTVSEGLHIGYYRGKREGSWFARYRPAGSSRDYVKTKLGKCDDLIDADGEGILDWKQALAECNKWIDGLHGDDEQPKDLHLTIRDVVVAHIADRDARDSEKARRPIRSTASSKLKPHVLNDEVLSRILLVELNESDLRNWQRRLVQLKGSSKQRVMAELKAALNSVYEEKRRALPPDFAIRIKHGLKPVFAEASQSESVAREGQVLDDDMVRKIVKTAKAKDADGDFAMVVMLMAATGARFAQLVRMRVADVQLDQNRLLVPASRKGKGKAKSAIRVAVSKDVVDALRIYCADRLAGDILLERWHHRQTGPIAWERINRQPWKTPSEMRRLWKKLVDELKIPDVVPYALRHSSIVRAIKAGLPIRLVAATHDTSVAMIERHYARWITDDLDELSARAVIAL
ncbi:tyrosine-type recombinase/integrase [Sphingobium phenoxybenzoativorans]|uniref:tyrosine-type recombinase/integrase n=1 Tax=Sphingobium phenoxybenzoativorans TaxID=1592790 RepID=UPI0008728264|nr:tyrosine-type recombinase/integrase [Sphingobium phenoxybenzoativorans]